MERCARVLADLRGSPRYFLELGTIYWMTTFEGRKRRLSLGAAQLRTGAGLELFALCQSVTEDGRLSKDDIIALKRWLDDNAHSDLPGARLLFEVVAQIVADRVVTSTERQYLYEAIKKVLPPLERRHASKARRNLLAERREAQQAASDAAIRQEKQRHKENKRDARSRNRAMAKFNFMIAGVHVENRASTIMTSCGENDRVRLVRDHANRFSKNAVKVCLLDGRTVGHVPETDAPYLAKFVDAGCPFRAWITTILTGGRLPIPVVQANFHRKDATLADLDRTSIGRAEGMRG